MTDERLSRRTLLAGTGAAALTGLAGCASLGGSPNDTAATTTPADAAVGSLSVTPKSAAVGDSVTVSGADLPANAPLQLAWEHVNGQWAVTQHANVVGTQYTTRDEPLATVRTDANGQFETTVAVPEDHGGGHQVSAVRDGSTVAKGSVRVTPTFTIDRTTAPLGESFTITVTGMPSSKYRRDDQVLWDNSFTGLLTGVTNRGTARAVVPAVGPPGTHVLEVGGGYEGVTYLNPQQSPYPRDFRYANWTVTVTAATGRAGDSWVNPVVDETPITAFYPAIADPQGSLSVTPTSGVVGSTATLEGSGLPANESVAIDWVTMTGSRVSGNGFSRTSNPLTTVQTDSSGAFSEDFQIPDDLGGTHPIVAKVGGTPRAVTGIVTQPSVVHFGPASGPVGTPLDVHLKGVGWTQYDNIYAVTYDNAFVGYGCGFNTQGDVEMQFRATGDPGMHVIECVPAIYKKPNESRDVDFYTKPQLTYLDDHPVRTLPVMRFLFEVTD